MTRHRRTERAAIPGSGRNDAESTNTVPSWELKDWQCMTIIVLLVVFFFRDILLGNAFFYDDFIYQNYPFRNFAATTMAMGHLPLWNPYTFNGMPFLADIQTAVFYLPCTALTLFVRDGHLHFYWLELVIIAHFVLAGASMFYLAGSFGVRRFPALFAGIAFSFSGFLIAQAIHQQIITLVAWYPLILLLFRRAITGGGWHWAFLAAIALGHSTFAGFPQLTLYLYVFLLAYFLFEFFTTYKGLAVFSPPAITTAMKAGSAVALSIAVAAIQLLPSLELAPLSQRAQITYDMAVQGSIAWPQLVTFFVPKFFGTAGGEGYNYWGPGPYWHFWETCIYLGAIPFMLFVISATLWKKNRYVPFFWGVALFALLFSLGDNFVLHRLFYEYFPGFSRFRIPARISVLLSLSSALLSAFSLQHVLYDQFPSSSIRRYRNLVLAVVGVVSLMWLMTATGFLSFSFFNEEKIFSKVKTEAAISGAIFIASGIALLTVLRGRQKPLFLLAVLGMLYVDMNLFGGRQNSAKNNPNDYYGRTNRLTEFLRKQGESEFFRVNSRNQDGMILDRNQGMIDRIFMMEGFTPLVLERAYPPLSSSDQMFDLLNIKYKTVTDTMNRRLVLAPHDTYLPRAFFLYDLHIVHSEEELFSYLKSPGFDHRAKAVLEKDPGFTLPTPAGTPTWRAAITSYENNRIMLDAETTHDGLLVLSEIYYPGWKAYVDGALAEVYRTDYNLRGLFVPKGSHKVEMTFVPETFADGAKITIATLAFCAAGSTLSIVRAKKRRSA